MISVALYGEVPKVFVSSGIPPTKPDSTIMNVSSAISLIDTISEAVRLLFTARYVSLAGLSILTYDIVLTIREEMSVMWTFEYQPSKVLRSAFCFNRYGMMMSMLIYQCVVSFPVATLSTNWVHWFGRGADCLESAGQHVWRRTCHIRDMLRLGLAKECDLVANCRLGLDIARINNLFRTMHLAVLNRLLLGDNTLSFLNLGKFKTCNVTHVPPEYTRAFYVNTTMELYLITFLILNALSRPRSITQGLFGLLANDGIAFFVITLSSKIANLIVISRAPAPIAITFPMFTMSLISTATGRLYLRYCSESGQAHASSRPNMKSLELGF
ncbi:hypothetical protein SCHPADRAFT_439949 [Schizopora paradoxa]|uniref:DUF6533 domain-containing protein n=1 Tax=Schizopora paradoxa TaxID=27342 RepID=A0A0H2RJ78_9AGAM|nr:hypothetical protein SCHPADRAFT_439949 [Schizopora paradoxa]